MLKEKYNLISALRSKAEELNGTKKLSLIGQGDFSGANNLMRSAMNIKHQTQHLTIDNPEFPFLYDGKENVMGEFSSFYTRTDKQYKVVNIIKKYDELLKGKCYFGLYFLHCKEDDSYRLVERKEVENLTENFGFDYKNGYLDNAEIGEVIPKGTVLYTSTSYDENMNVSIGVNGRILYAAHPAVQDDAIIISESFAERMVSNQVNSKSIPVNDNTIFLNLHGKNGEYKGLPDIGDIIENGIVAATRNVKETRMFSDLRDTSLSTINLQSDQVFYGDGQVIDINIYCNNPNLKMNKVNKQLIQYYNDAKWFYTEVYRTCKKIVNSGSTKVDKEINRWMRRSMDYLDTSAVWAFNDNIFSNVIVEILTRKKEKIRTGRKIVGRHGNKTITSRILPDNEMPYICTEVYKDEYGVTHPKPGTPIERVELISNPLAIINRTIAMALYEPDVTFITDRARKHMATMDNINDQEEFMFDIMGKLNPDQTKDLKKVYDELNDRDKKKFIDSTIENGMYVRWDPFNENLALRDSIISIYEKYEDVITPYHVFNPKPNWGRDIYLGQHTVGYQYMLLLKQSGERGFSARSAGAISDESLPEKSHESKISRHWCSETKMVRIWHSMITYYWSSSHNCRNPLRA